MKPERSSVVVIILAVFTFVSPARAAAQCGGDMQLACFNEQICVAPIPAGCVFGACWPETCAIWAPDLTRPSCQPGTGLEPIAGICQHCGAAGQFACSTGCDAGTTNVLGFCMDCGGEGQPACPGGQCEAWSNDVAGICMPCGENGALACFQGERCRPQHTELLGFCYSCGQAGQFTCNGQCASRLNPIAGLCVACGASLQPICGIAPECDYGNNPFAGFCVPECGGEGQLTCPTGPVCGPFLAPNLMTCQPIAVQPEPGTNAVATVTPGASPDAEVFGFADIHAHTFANLGFGGLWFWGAPFHQNGITYALPWCDFTQVFGKVNQFGVPIAGVPQIGVSVHGTNHILDLVGLIAGQPLLFNGGGSSLRHPAINEGNYDGYPHWKSVDHQSMYYRWIERSFLAGQRLMVMLAVNNETLCRIVDRRSDPGLLGFMNAFSCNDDWSLKRQLQAAHDMEAYIENLDGDPDNDSGWFKIAYSAQEARHIINKGKMAVILGLEASTLFDSARGDGRTPNVNAQVNEYYNLGARWVFPIHLWDNDFGGAAINQAASYIGNKLSAGEWFSTEDCSGPNGYDFGFRADALFDLAWTTLGGGPWPEYNPFAECNRLGLTDTGRALFDALIAKKMIIDVDHLSRRAVNDALAIAEEKHYPLVASHVRFHDISHNDDRSESARTVDQLTRIRDLGGVVAPALLTAPGGNIDRFDAPDNAVANDCAGSSKQVAQQYLYGIAKMEGGPHELPPVAFGTDFNAPAKHIAPRFGSDECMGEDHGRQANPVTYPFEAYGVPGSEFSRQQTGNRVFDYNSDGLAHAGLLPDLIEDMRRNGVTDKQLRPLFRSAEAVIRMWEWIDGRGTPAPEATYSISPAPNALGWNNGPVIVTLSASTLAGGSAIRQIRYSVTGGEWVSVRAGTVDVPVNDEGLRDIRFTVEDVAGHVTAEQTVHVQIDMTPPAASAARSEAPNAHGWYRGAVTVTFTGVDERSGVESCTSPVTRAAEGAGQQASGTCVDVAGNVSDPAIETGINIDLTPPSAQARRSPAANEHGWNNTPVTFGVDGEDTLSGVLNCTADVVLSGEGANQGASGRCEDKAGNVGETLSVQGINIDLTVPVVTTAVSPQPNAAGWNNTPVVVSFTGSDVLSGIASCTPAVTLASEGAGQSASGGCTDRAGNSSAPGAASGINIDVTPPVATSAVSPPPNAAGWNNTPVGVSFTGVDLLSGIAGCTPPITLGAEGADQSASGTCTDIAGNAGAPAVASGINIDLTVPIMSCAADPGLIWPPDHQLVPITNQIGLSDSLSSASFFRLLAAASSEADNGVADGDTTNDMQGFETGTDDVAGLVRAERAADGPGRRYTFKYEAFDRAGNRAECSTVVFVPRDSSGSY